MHYLLQALIKNYEQSVHKESSVQLLCNCIAAIYLSTVVSLVCFQPVTAEVATFIEKLKTRVRVGVVGGSDLIKIKEQLGDDGETHKPDL